MIDGRIPSYDELPPAPKGARSGWGLFGDDDSVGLFNLQTPETIRRAAGLIRTGEMFPLNAAIDAIDPPMFGRGSPQHTLLGNAGGGFDDKLDNYNPQASSQWDSLAHVSYDVDQFYNGATVADITSGLRNGVDHWARRGIAGRAVLLDLDAVLGGAGSGFDPATARAITVDELEQARQRTGVEFRAGDVILLHTGFLDWYRHQDVEVRSRLADTEHLQLVGLERGEDMARYLWNSHACAVAADNPAVEVWPPEAGHMPFGYMHKILIAQFGMAFGELWWLHDLAMSCRSDGRYECFLTSAPSNVRGGIASAPNALAIK